MQNPPEARTTPRRRRRASTAATPRAADSALKVYAQIRERVVNFGFRPDERINELQLAASLQVSRTPVREALNRLCSEGFVLFRPNKGFFFRALDIEELVCLSELRGTIEAGSFALACQRAKPEDVLALERFWKGALERYALQDWDEILLLDEAFHRQLAALSGNPEIVKALEGIVARLRFIRRIFIERGLHFDDLVDEHTRLLDALRGRDAEQGAGILRDHVRVTAEDARAAIKEALARLYLAADAPRPAVTEPA